MKKKKSYNRDNLIDDITNNVLNDDYNIRKQYPFAYVAVIIAIIIVIIFIAVAL